MEKREDPGWPKKYRILGVDISSTTYEESVHLMMSAARQNRAAIVTALPVHGVVTASSDPALGSMINGFDLAVPDGQPVRWALNWLYGTNLIDRVYGPELMLRLCRRAANEGIGVYFYGSYPHVIERLCENLLSLFPKLRIVGAESPPFRSLSQEEDREAVKRINACGAGLIFIGLGCPRQDIFAFSHRDSIMGVQVCVGAAFDFHSENKEMSPGWMQRCGLEWLFRLKQEPRRLWRRYVYTNSVFIFKLMIQIIRQKFIHSTLSRR